MNEEEKPQPKISLPEALFVGSFVALADAVELVLVFFLLDDFWISDAIAFPATQIYLRMKGVKGTYSLVGNGLELVPYVGWLPLRTIGFAITVWLDHHPKLEAAALGVTAIAGKSGVKGVEAGKTPPATREARALGATPQVAPAFATGGASPGVPPPVMFAEEAGEKAYERPESAPAISEEAFGVPKEPIEKVREIMERAPELEDTERRPIEENEDLREAA